MQAPFTFVFQIFAYLGVYLIISSATRRSICTLAKTDLHIAVVVIGAVFPLGCTNLARVDVADATIVLSLVPKLTDPG
jgi:hypothetical protein